MSQQQLELPKGWVETTVKNICNVSAGIGFPVMYQEQTQGKYPFYKVGDISKTVQKGETWLTKADNYVSDDVCKILKGKPFPKGTTVFAKIGEALKLNRRAIASDFSLFDNNVMGLIPIEELIENKYLFYFFNTVKLEKFSRATTVPSLRKGDIESIKFPLSPLNEQKRIISKIEELFSKIDSTKKSLEHIKFQLEQYRHSLLKSAFEGKLTEQWRENNNESEEWTKRKIDDIAELIGGGTPSRTIPEYFDGDIVWLTPTEIPKNTITVISDSREKITELGLKKSSAKIIPKDSVLLTSRASIGYVAISGGNVTTNQGFASFICSDVISNYFLAYWLWSKKTFLESKATGTTFKEINKSKLREIDILIPPLNEQKEIIAKIEQSFSLIENTQRIVNSTLQTLEIMRMSVLKQAFEGKLVPQDPNDEPAEILLEQIKKEREALMIKNKLKRSGRFRS